MNLFVAEKWDAPEFILVHILFRTVKPKMYTAKSCFVQDFGYDQLHFVQNLCQKALPNSDLPVYWPNQLVLCTHTHTQDHLLSHSMIQHYLCFTLVFASRFCLACCSILNNWSCLITSIRPTGVWNSLQTPWPVINSGSWAIWIWIQ